ncbi:MAG: UDP-3-O-[3-hydroxymyristoyl] N-acetylglucosamine deacetylase [Planctomycetes bacterium]|nr:UDP-3-O-[3-hydroxymyristoyl] N-acetylglucosamine deacetylase [Planctomycetota bacterium]
MTGVGLHTGEPVRLVLVPAAPGTGVVFVRTDLPGRPRIEARLESLGTRPRRTALVGQGIEVHTTEHLLAALYGAGVQDVEVRMDGPEVPGLDGSALPFYEAIRAAGVVGQGSPARELRVARAARVEDRGASVEAFPRRDGLRLRYVLDYGQLRPDGDPSLVRQSFELEVTEETFAREIAPARTFVLEEEVRALQAEGLGKGASTRNTLVVGCSGVIDNTLRFPDELARHKVLDLLGDLCLLGARIHGRILAVRSGHALNVRLARELAGELVQAGREAVGAGRTPRGETSEA